MVSLVSSTTTSTAPFLDASDLKAGYSKGEGHVIRGSHRKGPARRTQGMTFRARQELDSRTWLTGETV